MCTYPKRVLVIVGFISTLNYHLPHISADTTLSYAISHIKTLAAMSDTSDIALEYVLFDALLGNGADELFRYALRVTYVSAFGAAALLAR